MKKLLKKFLVGSPGSRPRKISFGLLRGLQFHVDTASKSMRLMGLDETEIAGVTRRLAKQARCAVDVGAADGWYSLYFAAQTNIEQVFAFEPNEDCRLAMEANFGLNAPALRLKLHLSDQLVGKERKSGWCRLDDELANLPRPLLIKIDVDGGELDVLAGAEKVLLQGANLIVETHSQDLETSCITYLQHLGYQTRIIKNGWYRLLIPETRPIPHNRWFVASKKE